MKIKRKEVTPLIPMVIHKDLREAFEAIWKDLKEKQFTDAPARPDAADGGKT